MCEPGGLGELGKGGGGGGRGGHFGGGHMGIPAGHGLPARRVIFSGGQNWGNWWDGGYAFPIYPYPYPYPQVPAPVFAGPCTAYGGRWMVVQTAGGDQLTCVR